MLRRNGPATTQSVGPVIVRLTARSKGAVSPIGLCKRCIVGDLSGCAGKRGTLLVAPRHQICLVMSVRLSWVQKSVRPAHILSGLD